jgi:hypothetical protein
MCIRKLLLLFFLIPLYACSPSEEEIAQVAKETYHEHKTTIDKKFNDMSQVFNDIETMSPDALRKPFDLETRPSIDINTYPKNGIVIFKKSDLEYVFKAVNSLKDNVEFYGVDSIEEAKRQALRPIESLEKIRYISIIQVQEKQQPKLASQVEFKDKNIKMKFHGGKATARVFTFDLQENSYLGVVDIKARSSQNINIQGIDFQSDIEFDLIQNLKEAAITEIQYWDEVNRK